MSAEFEAGVEESLELTQRWLKEEECGSLSISQSGGLLALVCLRSGTNLGAYLKRSIEPPGSDDGKSGRRREILPLPLWADGKEELRNLFDPETSENSVGLKRRPADMQGVPVY